MTPTKKQWKFAKQISNKLNIPMPKEYTKKSYFEYIRDNKDEFYQRFSCRTYDLDDAEDFLGHLFMG